MKKNIKLLTRLSLLIALSAIAAYFPLPSPTGTVALDSAPGYFTVLFFGGFEGALVLLVGHLFSALKSGFPLGIIHVLIAFLMGGCGLVFYWLNKKIHIILAAVLTVLVNGIVVPLTLIPFLGKGFFGAMLLPLLFGSLVNVVVAVILYRLLKDRVDGIGHGN